MNARVSPHFIHPGQVPNGRELRRDNFMLHVQHEVVFGYGRLNVRSCLTWGNTFSATTSKNSDKVDTP